MNANRDANHIPVMIGIGDNGETMPVAIDHVTGRVLAEIHSLGSSASNSFVTRALHDANHVGTTMGVSDDSNDTHISIAIDHRNGFPIVDMTVE